MSLYFIIGSPIQIEEVKGETLTGRYEHVDDGRRAIPVVSVASYAVVTAAVDRAVLLNAG